MTAAVVAFAAIVLLQRFGAASAGREFKAVEAGYVTSLSDAFARSESEGGKPLYVLVTADWCAPCQMLKGNTLANDQVAGKIDKAFVPVYLEESASTEDLLMLPPMVRKVLPTSLVIADKQIVAVLEGYAGPGDFEEFLSDGLERAAKTGDQTGDQTGGRAGKPASGDPGSGDPG